uniref:heme-binding protein soul2 n=1 Tax=Semicossyphus pulcher TaxID=241346 RepID=UPI0037E9830A
MEQPLVLLVSFLLVSLCRGQSLCSNETCPKYEVCDKNEDFEMRSYGETEWLTTKVDNSAIWDAHLRLKDYCNKQKEAGYIIRDDTWPVLLTQGPDGCTLSWFVPPNTEKPKTLDELVTFETKPAGIYYVKVFGGFPSLASGQTTKEQLCAVLDKALKTYDHNSFSGAGYEPYLSITHHNEVWIHA